MADELHQPHDKLFRAVFSDTAEAASLLQAALPDTIRDQLDWPTLTLLDGTFLDDHLRENESDLLYQLEHIGTRERVWLYALFEHQSSPDKWMRFRLMKYCCRIWDASFRVAPEQSQLPLVLPVVFYQGVRDWTHSTELADLFPESMRSWPWVPRFAHVLLDQTGLEPGEVVGGLKGRIVQLLMMASFRRHASEALELAAQLASSLSVVGGVNELRQFVVYVMVTQEPEVVEAFGKALRRYGDERGDEIMTYAEQLLAEGEAKGEQRGKVEVVEGFLRVGVSWEVIEAATGLNETRFQALKAQLASGS